MYEVGWLDEAIQELTQIWMQADIKLRKVMTAASHEVDTQLARDPLAESESHVGITRIRFFAPLAITFQLEPDGKTVTVLQVRKYRTH